MQKVFTSPDLGEATLIKDVLLKENIPCMLKNEVLSGGMSFIFGYTNTWPEVWILKDEDSEKAQQIVKDWSSEEV